MIEISKVNKIKRVNERLAEIRKQVASGDLPQTALTQYESAVKLVAGKNTTKSGNISHGKKALEEVNEDHLNALLQKASTKSIKETLRRKAKEEDVSYQEYIDIVEVVNEAARTAPGELSDAIEAYGKAAKQGRNTPYSVLYMALENYRRGEAQVSSQVARYFEGAENSEASQRFIPFED